MLRHQGAFSTLYAHLSRFAPRLRNGARVAQGEVIGYVGQTGWATGPHLHYEFRVADVQRNPLTVALPGGEPLPPSRRARVRRADRARRRAARARAPLRRRDVRGARVARPARSRVTSKARRELYAGVMSGTSLDGIDAVLADFAPGAGAVRAARRHAHRVSHRAAPASSSRCRRAERDEIVRAARAANALADLYAHALRSVCLAAGVPAHDVVAAGVHGQTIRHRPDEGWTLQLNNPARVAEQAYMTVVADFRSRDVAAGGQGAPLVPAFHAALFGGGAHRVVVNLGGIANLTDLPAEGGARGFDTGPGNVLLDLWHARHRGAPFDRDGAWARTGTVDARLLAALLAEPYFARSPPKSTGRDLFNARWLDTRARRLAGGDRRTSRRRSSR